MNLSEDYLSPEKRALVDGFKARILAGELNHRFMGFLTAESTGIPDILAAAIYGDEQGPWSVEDPHTELDLARYELAIEAWEARIREEVRAELRAELRAEVEAELEAGSRPDPSGNPEPLF